MRKFILIAGLVLVSATAQAGERSLSMTSDTPSVTAPAKAADTSKTAEVQPAAGAPQAVEAPPAEAPKYVERPPVVDPKSELPTAMEQNPGPAKPYTERTAPAPRAAKPRHTRYWNEARIIGELHRHGIYW
jgi:hypothetical protein